MLIDETIYAGKRVKQFVGYDGGVCEGGQEDRRCRGKQRGLCLLEASVQRYKALLQVAMAKHNR